MSPILQQNFLTISLFKKKCTLWFLEPRLASLNSDSRGTSVPFYTPFPIMHSPSSPSSIFHNFFLTHSHQSHLFYRWTISKRILHILLNYEQWNALQQTRGILLNIWAYLLAYNIFRYIRAYVLYCFIRQRLQKL